MSFSMTPEQVVHQLATMNLEVSPRLKKLITDSIEMMQESPTGLLNIDITTPLGDGVRAIKKNGKVKFFAVKLAKRQINLLSDPNIRHSH